MSPIIPKGKWRKGSQVIYFFTSFALAYNSVSRKKELSVEFFKGFDLETNLAFLVNFEKCLFGSYFGNFTIKKKRILPSITDSRKWNFYYYSWYWLYFLMFDACIDLIKGINHTGRFHFI